MYLYLVQHAEAKREEEDPARSLTERGRRQIEGVASHVSSMNLKLDRIVHSQKLRAAQTAEILEQHLKTDHDTVEADGLAPMDDPAVWARRLEELKENLMLVGHLPHLERLASLLLTGDAHKRVVSFSMGGVVCLNRAEEGYWTVRWIVTPETCPHHHA